MEEHSNTDGTPYLFNGKELDEETGLYYYGARYYDPRTSIFQSVDGHGERYPGWSPYSYTFNNPLRYIDPTGLDPEDPASEEGTLLQEVSITAERLPERKINTDPLTKLSVNSKISNVIGPSTQPAQQEEPQTWYYMQKFQGGPHALVYNINTGIIYDVNHPNNGNTNGLNSWLNGGQKSVGYKFNMKVEKEAEAFWAFGGGRGTLWLKSVTITNPEAATAFFESQVGTEWDYNLLTNNCKHFAIQGFELGGAKLTSGGPDPSIWYSSGTGTSMYWNSTMAAPAPVKPLVPYMPTGKWPIMYR